MQPRRAVRRYEPFTSARGNGRKQANGTAVLTHAPVGRLRFGTQASHTSRLGAANWEKGRTAVGSLKRFLGSGPGSAPTFSTGDCPWQKRRLDFAPQVSFYCFQRPRHGTQPTFARKSDFPSFLARLTMGASEQLHKSREPRWSGARIWLCKSSGQP